MALGLTIIWAALILAFVAGVRRGFGFGTPSASLAAELLTMATYYTLSGLALIAAWLGHLVIAVAFLAIGFVLVAVIDPIAARSGNAPRHFAALRAPQMAIAVLSLLAIVIRIA